MNGLFAATRAPAALQQPWLQQLVPWGQQPSGQHSAFLGQIPVTPQQRWNAGAYGNRPAQQLSHGPAAVSPQQRHSGGMQCPRPLGVSQHLSLSVQHSVSWQFTGRSRLHLQRPWSVQVWPSPQQDVTLRRVLPAQHLPKSSSQQIVWFCPMQPFSVDLQQTPRLGSTHFSPDRQHLSPHPTWQHRPRSELTHFSSGLQQAPPQSFVHLQVGPSLTIGPHS
jgi:hypothetical protein